MIAALAYQEYKKRVGDAASKTHGEIYDMQMAPAILQRILEANGRGWFSDHEGVLLQSLADGIAIGRRMQGGSIRRWDYGNYNELTIVQPVGNRLPLVAEILQCRSDSDERFLDHCQTDDPQARAFDEICRGSFRLGKVIEQFDGR